MSSPPNKLVEAHLYLVNRVVGQESKKLGLDKSAVEEMRSFAMEGLVAAVQRYDPNRGVPAKNYLEMRMRWAIYDGLDQMAWFPRRLRRQIAFYRRASDMLRSQQKAPPPKDKVEAVHRLSDRLKELATAYVTTFAAEDYRQQASVPPEAEEALERKRFSQRIKVYIDTLPPKEHHVIKRYFFDDAKLGEIATELGVTPSWISRLLSAGLKKLRTYLDGETELVASVRESDP